MESQGKTIIVASNIDDISLQEFKELVSKWLECDNFIKKVKQEIKEKTKHKNELMSIITTFMSKYQIDDLNTPQGKISYKKTHVKKPKSSKAIKEQVMSCVGGDPQAKEQIERIYKDCEKVEKVSLRRSK